MNEINRQPKGGVESTALPSLHALPIYDFDLRVHFCLLPEALASVSFAIWFCITSSSFIRVRVRVRGATSERPPFLAIVYANGGGVPPNRAHRARGPGPRNFDRIEGQSCYEKPRYFGILLGQGPRIGQNRLKLRIQRAAELHILYERSAKSNPVDTISWIHGTGPHRAWHMGFAL